MINSKGSNNFFPKPISSAAAAASHEEGKSSVLGIKRPHSDLSPIETNQKAFRGKIED